MKIDKDEITLQGKRNEQQDSLGWFGFDAPDFAVHGGVLGVVCDGMGGMENGGEAAEIAIKAFLSAYGEKPENVSIIDALKIALLKANVAVCKLANNSGIAIGDIGTTLAAVVVHNESLYWISVGDSRIYLLRPGHHLLQLTEDLNFGFKLKKQVALGEITKAAADNDPNWNALISYVGMQLLDPIDRNIKPYKLQDGDKLLVCSDGIHGVLQNHEIEEYLALPTKRATEKLKHAVLAKAHPNQDNFTALVLACGQQHVDSKYRILMTILFSKLPNLNSSKIWLFGFGALVALLLLAFGIKLIYQDYLTLRTQSPFVLTTANTLHTEETPTQTQKILENSTNPNTQEGIEKNSSDGTGKEHNFAPTIKNKAKITTPNSGKTPNRLVPNTDKTQKITTKNSQGEVK